MFRACTTASMVVVLVLVAPGAAEADTAPCPPGQALPALTVTDSTGGGALFATHVLAVGLQPSDTAGIRSLTAPGARVFTDGDDPNHPTLVTDRPGPLTLTAVVESTTCTATVTRTVVLQTPRASVFGQFKRPHYIVPARKLYSPDPRFSFTVRLAKVGADQSPLTVRVRASRRLKVPGPGVKAVSHAYPLRAFEIPDTEPRGCELLCSKKTSRGFARSLSVSASRIGLKGLKGLKVLVEGPTGYPYTVGHGERFRRTPWGADVEVLQSGTRLARLRVAARCDSGGQSSRCRFKKIDTRR